MDKEFDRASPAGPAPLEEVEQSVNSDLQYISIQVDGATYGGWYRLLTDGQMELLALANMHCERRPERTPIEQARGMLADFIRVARPKWKTNGSASIDANNGSSGPTDKGAGDCTTGTLGDLLYAQMKTRVSEKDWVGVIQSMAAGDQLALRALYERTHRVVFTLIMRLTNNRRTAEELTLDVFHDVWRRAAEYDAAAGSVLGWITNRARSRAVDYLEFEQRNKRANADTYSACAMNAARDASDVLGVEQDRRLQKALTVLSPDERQAIETTYFSELGYVEVAAQLRQPPPTVKTRIRSGLEKLGQALATEVEEP